MSRTLDLEPVLGEPGAGTRRVRRERIWSQARLAGGLVLAAWASLFWFLILSGRVNLYLSARTAWIAPVGAGMLTVAALGRLAAARGKAREPLRRREAVVMALLVLPVVVVMASPPETLGAFSAPRKARFSATRLDTFYGAFDETSDITLLMVAAGQTSEEGSELLATRAGSPVDFVGFVVRNPDTPADELLLTRYVITCCAADATVVQVRVVNVTPGRFDENDWVRVRGQIFPLGREVIVAADSIEEVPRPDRPYLTP
jgi:uncharacterized repeat protein (TIGR03943 family)